VSEAVKGNREWC